MAVKQRLQEAELFYKLGPILLSTAPRWHAITHTWCARWTLISFVLPAYFKPHFSAGSSLPAEFLVLVDTHTSALLLPVCERITGRCIYKNRLSDCLISCYFINLPLFPSRGAFKNKPFDLRTFHLGPNNEMKLYCRPQIIRTQEGFSIWICSVWMLNIFGAVMG